MTPPSHSISRPRTARRTTTNTAQLTDHLWKSVLTLAGPLEIHMGCEQQLRGIIAQGAERMALENRTAPGDIAMAEENLGRFVGLMKHSAELLGHPQVLGEDTLLAADQTLIVLAFRPWPFRSGKPYEQRG